VICGDATQPAQWLKQLSESAVQFDRILLYAPCSALPEENALQIEQFLTNNVDAKLEPLPFTVVEGAVGYQFLPTENGGDGFYYAKLRKVVS
ncbi:16S rRNA (cytosine(967)-C(5))-methyltransferase, partial [Pasteurella multocida]